MPVSWGEALLWFATIAAGPHATALGVVWRASTTDAPHRPGRIDLRSGAD